MGFDNVVMEGNPTPQDKRFVAYYLKEDKVIGVATCTRDPVAVAAAELIRYVSLQMKPRCQMITNNTLCILLQLQGK